MTTLTQASPRESIVTLNYWSDYASSIFCECHRFWHRSRSSGYRAVNTSDMVGSTDNSEYDSNGNENTEDTEAE